METRNAAKVKRLFNKSNRVIIAVTIAAVCLVLLAVRISTAWLYDEDDAKVDYNIVRLNMEVSSNHMNTYYLKNTVYEDGAQQKNIHHLMEQLLAAESQYETHYTQGEALTDFKNVVDMVLKQLYPEDFVDELMRLQTVTYANISEENIASYNQAAQALYRKFTSYINMPFEFRNLDIDRIDTDKGLLDYSVSSLLEQYETDFVSQYSDGYNNATVPIQLKLRGATTFSNQTNADYYDDNFNEMVLPVSMKIENTGDTDMFMRFKFVNKNGIENALCSNGILVMIAPYGMNFTNPDEGDFRTLIYEQLSSYTRFSGDALNVYNTGNLSRLNYADMKTLLDAWNEAALETYYTAMQTAAGNIQVAASGTTSFNINMVCWADYETCYTQYNTDNGYHPSPEYSMWDTNADVKYGVYMTDLYFQFRSSLKNVNLDWSENFDSSMQYNSEAMIDKMVGVSNFEVEGNAYFDGNGVYNDGVFTSTDTDALSTDRLAKNYMSGGYIDVNYTDPSSDNYIGKFRLDFRYRGFSPANIRVRIIEQWTNSSGDIVGINLIPFTYDKDWVDNRLNDLYLYSKKEYYSTNSDSKVNVTREDDSVTQSGKLLIKPVITGVDSNFYKSGDNSYFDPTIGTTYRNLTLKLSILIEAVQPNRVQEFWDLGNYPSLDAFVDSLQ